MNVDANDLFVHLDSRTQVRRRCDEVVLKPNKVHTATTDVHHIGNHPKALDNARLWIDAHKVLITAGGVVPWCVGGRAVSGR